MKDYELVGSVVAYLDGKAKKATVIRDVLVYSVSDHMIQFKEGSTKVVKLTLSSVHKSEQLHFMFRNIRRLNFPSAIKKMIKVLGFKFIGPEDNYICNTDGKNTVNIEFNIFETSIAGTRQKKLSKLMFRLLDGYPNGFSTKPITEWVVFEPKEESTLISSKPVSTSSEVAIGNKPVVKSNDCGNLSFQLATQLSVLGQLTKDYDQPDFIPVGSDIVRLSNVVNNIGAMLRTYDGEDTDMLTVYHVVSEICSLILRSTTIEKTHFELLAKVVRTFNIGKMVDKLNTLTPSATQA